MNRWIPTLSLLPSGLESALTFVFPANYFIVFVSEIKHRLAGEMQTPQYFIALVIKNIFPLKYTL